MSTVERIQAHHDVIKRLGNWSTADHFEVRARGGAVVLDLRAPEIPDDSVVDVDLDHSVLTLLVPDDAAIDHWDLRWTAKGKVKDPYRPHRPGPRQLHVTGCATNSEVRIHRGGIARLTAIASREFLADARRSSRTGEPTTVDDPARRAR